MKTALKWIFLIVRALLRFLFIDCGGQDYLKATWRPSSRVCTTVGLGPEADPEGEFDHSSYGSDMPGIFLPPAVVLAVVFAPLWVPLLLWEWSQEWREEFVKWIGADQ